MSMSQDDPRRDSEGRQAGDAVEKSATEASGGAKTGHIRWVLVFSLLLVVIVLGAAWITYSNSHRPEPPPTSQAELVSAPTAG